VLGSDGTSCHVGGIVRYLLLNFTRFFLCLIISCAPIFESFFCIPILHLDFTRVISFKEYWLLCRGNITALTW